MASNFESLYKLARLRISRSKCHRILLSMLDDLMTSKCGLTHNVRFYVAERDASNRRPIGWIVGVAYEGDIMKDADAKVRLDILVYSAMANEMISLCDKVKENKYGLALSQRKEDPDDQFSRDMLESLTIVADITQEKSKTSCKDIKTNERSISQCQFDVPAGADMSAVLRIAEQGYGVPIGEYYESRSQYTAVMSSKSESMTDMQMIDIMHSGLVPTSIEPVCKDTDGYDSYMLSYYDDGNYGHLIIKPRMIGNSDRTDVRVLFLDCYSFGPDDGEVKESTASTEAVSLNIQELKKHVAEVRMTAPYSFDGISRIIERYRRVGSVFATKKQMDNRLEDLKMDGLYRDKVREFYPPKGYEGFCINSATRAVVSDTEESIFIEYYGPEGVTFVPRLFCGETICIDCYLLPDNG